MAVNVCTLPNPTVADWNEARRFCLYVHTLQMTTYYRSTFFFFKYSFKLSKIRPERSSYYYFLTNTITAYLLPV